MLGFRGAAALGASGVNVDVSGVNVDPAAALGVFSGLEKAAYGSVATGDENAA
jgi:hypothetical protein